MSASLELRFQCSEIPLASQGAQFGLNNKRCFFLVDYSESENDDEVPVLYYEWTGESLKPLPQLANEPEVQTSLKDEVPFTQRRRMKPSNREPPPIRRLVKSRLYSEQSIPESDLDYMREHPEDREWLKTHVRPRFCEEVCGRTEYVQASWGS
ncbi:hypothetical protein PHISCL_02422 [Aspergillus sclerotialis]|uniref:Uncharacterized protein n=1 Tax=Aspergillus sclerotialis TaxID=2070753 RepID=A0A3A2ZQ39_9EURO|nr:hypothetical protein PHISCL_02422 [Aspergillus sclerotialis]